MKRVLRILRAILMILVLLVVAAVGGLYWASRGFDAEAPAPPPEHVPSAESPEASPPADPSEPLLRVMTYNIHHGAGPVGEFEYHSEEEQRGYLGAIAALIRAQDADIVALQEVDYASARSHDIDQLALLADAAGYPYRARITTWQKNYVPFPGLSPAGHVGRIHSGQAVMSRYPILSNRRVVLPQPTENAWWYNAFYLNRSIQIVEVQVGAQRVAVFNCHLEAYNARNREVQAPILTGLVQESTADGWIVLGDMNALPPEAPRFSGFEDEPDWDGANDRTISMLRAALGAELPPSGSDDSAFTFPGPAPSRRLDYIFSSPSLLPRAAQVLREEGRALSDHLPVVADVGGQPRREPAPPGAIPPGTPGPPQ